MTHDQTWSEPPRCHVAKDAPQGARQSNVGALWSGDALIAGNSPGFPSWRLGALAVFPSPGLP